MKIIVIKRFNINENVNSNNNVDKSNRSINKQNRERQNDFSQ